MGGRDKGLIEWHGRPLIAWVHETVRALTDDLLLSCNRNQTTYAPYADRLLSDAEPDYPGPLAGIRAGLAAAHHDWLMVLPCDAPMIDALLLRSLHAIATQDPLHPLMVRRAAQVSGSQLSHYFPDKEHLVQAVIERRLDFTARFRVCGKRLFQLVGQP